MKKGLFDKDNIWRKLEDFIKLWNKLGKIGLNHREGVETEM